MISESIISGFSPRHEAVGCFCNLEGRMLLLLRQDNIPEGNKWGLPSGKIEKGESPMDAIRREVWEETSISLPKEKLIPFRTFYVRYPEYDFVYHTFSAELEKPEPVVVMPKEHKDFYWARPSTALKMRLVMDLDECIRQFYGI